MRVVEADVQGHDCEEDFFCEWVAWSVILCSGL